MCDALGMRVKAAAAEVNSEARKLLQDAAKRLLAAVAHSSEAPEPVSSKEQQKWARLAVKCITEVGAGGVGLGEPTSMVALYLKLGQFKNALDVCNRE